MNKDTVPHSRAYSLRLWTALFVYLTPAAIVAQGISDFRIDTPRDFGYSIGDKITHEMHLSLSEPLRLDTTSLPETGRLNRWLEISRAEANVEHRNQILSYRIIVDYQIFNAPPQLKSVTIPQLEFLTTGGASPIPVFIPEWTFSIGPITNSDARHNLNLRPDRQPQPIPVIGRGIRLVISMFLLTVLLTYLAYRLWLLPRFKRDRYPFSSALYKLRKLQRLDFEPENYRLGLQAFHAAVNATAGQVVFAGSLHDFLSANTKYATLEADLSALYARSQDVFFSNSKAAEPHTSLQELVDICQHCRALERSVN